MPAGAPSGRTTSPRAPPSCASPTLWGAANYLAWRGRPENKALDAQLEQALVPGERAYAKARAAKAAVVAQLRAQNASGGGGGGGGGSRAPTPPSRRPLSKKEKRQRVEPPAVSDSLSETKCTECYRRPRLSTNEEGECNVCSRVVVRTLRKAIRVAAVSSADAEGADSVCLL